MAEVEVVQLSPEERGNLRDAWRRVTDDPEKRGVTVAGAEFDEAEWMWQVWVDIAEIVRDTPLDEQLRQGMATGLGAVSGVRVVERSETKIWTVRGTPDGETLIRATVQIVDRVADLSRGAGSA